MTRSVFVLGAPRSGTTLIGALVGSCPGVCDMGEFGGMYFAHKLAVDEFDGMPGAFVERYLADLQTHAQEFPARVARERSCDAYCDATPWNLLVADALRSVQDALFVLMLRDYRGVIQSLGRSYASGYPWAGADVSARAGLWAEFYGCSLRLPPERTMLLDYDELCHAPEITLKSLIDRLCSFDIDAANASITCVTRSHAADGRPTIGRLTSPGRVVWTPRATWDSAAWSEGDELAAAQHVGTIDAAVRARFERGP